MGSRGSGGSFTGLKGIKRALGISARKRVNWRTMTKSQASRAINQSRGMSKGLFNKLRSVERG